ncbi:hypothetical protein E2R51_12020 [Jeotgalibacillus sp. S-D1]|uniref:hypothetical protein n=1 Tax=Jeotgalibacillus sp. S-D1 TaxID=2552189 RepID=UPI00105A75D3|nr:hypothetical protein [Jeotgalibacillus sp. S-D1]TDL31938.1 hypothetical protein E2R51_12020 [Jeotgalibacillus sp. S-D1]
MKNGKKIILITISLVFYFSFLGPSFSYAEENKDTSRNNLEGLESVDGNVLDLIDQLPDSVSDKGIEASTEWLNENKGEDLSNVEFSSDSENMYLTTTEESTQNNLNMAKASWSEIGACAVALGAAAVQVLPWAKILKLKKAAKVAGGLEKLFTKLINSYKHQRNLGYSKTNASKRAVDIVANNFPKDLKDAMLEVLGVGGAITACGVLLK